MVKLSPGQQDVLAVIKAHGPVTDQVLVPLAQYMFKVPQSSSSIRTRRSELVRKGLVREKGVTKTRSGREAIIWSA